MTSPVELDAQPLVIQQKKSLDTLSVHLSPIIHEHQPDLKLYENIYRTIHQNPELSGKEFGTATLVASHLSSLGFAIYPEIGGFGVVALLSNGPGKTVLIRAELDALPMIEETGLPYASTKFMTNRYGDEKPVAHACGHDMNISALLAASALLKNAREEWSGTLVVVFQPDAEGKGGAQAMVGDEMMYDKTPFPDIMLAQHVTSMPAGTVSINSGPVLMASDHLDVRIFRGGPEGVNPQFCPIKIAMKIILKVPDVVARDVGDELARVCCWSFHGGGPGTDDVPHADFTLDIKTLKPEVRKKVLHSLPPFITWMCKIYGCLKAPEIHSSVRAPLTTNSDSVVEPISKSFLSYFGSDVVPMKMPNATEDFSALKGHFDIPYAYWFFGSSKAGAEKVSNNHEPNFAPEIQPTLKTGMEAMALAVLSHLSG